MARHMTLADLPHHAACTVAHVGFAVRDAGYHLVAGVRDGVRVRMLARYPESAPRFVEVEVGGHTVVTLPLGLARQVSLECGC